MSDNAQSHGPGNYYLRPAAKGLSKQLNGNVSSAELLEKFLALRPDELAAGLSAMANEKSSRAKCHGQQSLYAVTSRFLGKHAFVSTSEGRAEPTNLGG